MLSICTGGAGYAPRFPGFTGGFMAIYTIGDLHLSLGADKAMDIFPGWENYVARIEENWKNTVREEDTVVLAGDISWGMSLQQALRDFQFIDALPGKKLLLKGNHDYWWTTRAKMEAFFEENGIRSLSFLHNSASLVEGLWLCGSRGWIFENGQEHDRKITAREATRLELSLKSAEGAQGERVAFLHYPPLYGNETSVEILDVLRRYEVRRCYYGHIHSAGCAWALEGEHLGITFKLISADYLRFCPHLVPLSGK